jgi:hypothetical protein
MESPFAKTTVYAVRDVETGQRLSYRYRSRRDAIECRNYIASASGKGDNLEVYRTTQDLPKAGKPWKG